MFQSLGERNFKDFFVLGKDDFSLSHVDAGIQLALPSTLQPVQNQNTATVAQNTTATPQSVSATPQNIAATPEFDFKTLQEYSDGLEKIFQAYQDGKISIKSDEYG